uniref:Uncharacterized protein n=1 Tax=Anopheles farauti TaxID=69004 RepID=A0A182QDN1_9DIPT
MQWVRNARKPTGRRRSATTDGRFYLCYTHSTRDTVSVSPAWIFSFGGTTGAESQRRWLMNGDALEAVVVTALDELLPLEHVLVVAAVDAALIDGEEGMPSLLALLLLLDATVVVVVVGMTVFSRSSDESSDTPNVPAPPPPLLLLPFVPPSLEDAEEPPPSDPLLTPWLLPTDDSIVELTSGSPISWKEFIELKPLSNGGEGRSVLSSSVSVFVEDDVECTESAVLLRTDSRLPRMFSFRLNPTVLRVFTRLG